MSTDKNPWGSNGSDGNKTGKSGNDNRGAWHGGGESGGPQGPDLDDVIRNLQNQLQGKMPGGLKLVLLGVVAGLRLWGIWGSVTFCG